MERALAELETFAPGLRARVAGADEAAIARLEEAVGRALPAAYRVFLAGVGADPGPLAFRAMHGPLDCRLATVLAVATAPKKKVKAARPKASPDGLVYFGSFTGTCQDCGPCFLSEEGAVLQPDTKRESSLLAPSLAAYVFLCGLESLVAPRLPHAAGVLPPPKSYEGLADAVAARLPGRDFVRHEEAGCYVHFWRADVAVLVPARRGIELVGDTVVVRSRAAARAAEIAGLLGKV